VIFLARVVTADLEGLALAADIVAKGGLVCYPTDTVYGLGCDPLNPTAIRKAIAAKGKRAKPMPVLVKATDDAKRLTDFSESAQRLADRFWPGPLTIVLTAKDSVPSILAPQRTLGVRSPKHALCQQLLTLCFGYLVGTSANLTGRPPATSALEVKDQLGDRVDIILDAGTSSLGIASTVVDLTKRRLTIVREGPIDRHEILRCLKGKAR
jgi:L-threonylcarbamoyladenylate synthase